ADRADVAFLDRDVGFDDAPVIDDQRVGDDGIGRALLVGRLRLAHAVADHLAAAELHLLAIGGEVLLHLDDEVGVGKPHLVAGGGPEHSGIDGTFDFRAHSELLASFTVLSNAWSSQALPPRQPATTCSAQLV